MLIGVLLIMNALVLMLIVNFNSGIIITFILGLILLCYGIWNKKINEISCNGIMKWLRYLISAGIIFMVCMIAFIAIVGQIDTATFEEDAVIILGAGIRGEAVTLPLAYRLDKGVEYINKNPNAVVVVTGGQGPQENITEALAMEKYLISKGISDNKIIKEEKATSTYENFKFSKTLLDEHFKRPYKITCITNDFHIYRAGQLAKIVGIDATSYSARLQWYAVPITYLREFLAVLKLWVLRR
jgi:uncharacterized SAM-binding protein YcdF (DUF218 family)